jgi:site-specific DNA recombinase
MCSSGHHTFGYDYVRKTPTSPAALVVNEVQAAIVRSIFEMFAGGRFGLVTICRHLEEHHIPTCTGRARWHMEQLKAMLMNETYAGTRYYNRITAATEEALRKGAKLIRGRSVYRDRAAWLSVAVPAIVSRELFDTVQSNRHRSS